jgi:hypothetical protein
VERAGEPGSGGHGATGDRRRVASGRVGQSNPRTTTKGRAIAQSKTRPRYRGQGHGGLVAPILMLHKQRDAHYERPCALCERLRALCERGCVLAPPSPCAGGAGLASHREVSPTGAPRPSCCCAPLGARVKSEQITTRSGAPVGASAAWDSDCGLSNWSGVICGSAGGACSLCLWSCAAPPGSGPESFK